MPAEPTSLSAGRPYKLSRNAPSSLLRLDPESRDPERILRPHIQVGLDNQHRAHIGRPSRATRAKEMPAPDIIGSSEAR